MALPTRSLTSTGTLGSSSAPRISTFTSRFRPIATSGTASKPVSLTRLSTGTGTAGVVAQQKAADTGGQWMPHTQGQNLFKPADPNAPPAQDQPPPQDQGVPQDQTVAQNQPPAQDQGYPSQGYPTSGGGGGGGGGGWGPDPSQQSQSDDSDDDDSGGYMIPNDGSSAMDTTYQDVPPPPSLAPASKATKGIFHRLWTWLFGSKDSSVHGDGPPLPRTQEEAIKELVERARAGDQNAMAMIASVSEQAKKKNPTALRSFGLLHKYIRENPPDAAGMHADPPRHRGPNVHANYHAFRNRDTHATRVTPRAAALSHGRPLTAQNIQAIHSRFGNESESDLFAQSMVKTHRGQGRQIAAIAKQLGPRARSVANFGADVATARALQLVRLPDSCISKFDPLVGWELGE